MTIYVQIWRYSINEGEFGGLVYANTFEEAEAKVKQKYPNNNNEIQIWRLFNDDYFDTSNPDVWECYGL
jgi:hypothetical protein